MSNLLEYEIDCPLETEEASFETIYGRRDKTWTLPLRLTREEVNSLLAFAMVWPPEYNAVEETLIAKLRLHMSGLQHTQSAQRFLEI